MHRSNGSVGSAPSRDQHAASDLVSASASSSTATPSPSQIPSQTHSNFAPSWVNRVRRGHSNSTASKALGSTHQPDLSSSSSSVPNRANPPSSPSPSYHNQSSNAQQPLSSKSISPISRKQALNPTSNPGLNRSTTSPSSQSSLPNPSYTMGSASNQNTSLRRAVGGDAAGGGGGTPVSSSLAQSNLNHHSKNSSSLSGSASGLSRFFSIRKRKDSSQGHHQSVESSSKIHSTPASASGGSAHDRIRSSFPNNNNHNQSSSVDSRRRSVPSVESPPLAIIAGKGWGVTSISSGNRNDPFERSTSRTSKRASTSSSTRSDVRSSTATSPLQTPKEFGPSSKRPGGSTSRTPLGSPNLSGEATFFFPPKPSQESAAPINQPHITHSAGPSRHQQALSLQNSNSPRALSLFQAEDHQSSSPPVRSTQYSSQRPKPTNLPSTITSSSRFHQASQSVPLAQIAAFPARSITSTSPASSPRAGKSTTTLPLEMDEELRSRTISEGPRRKGSFKRTKSISNRIGQLLSGVGSNSQAGSSIRAGSIKSGKSDESSRVTGNFGSKDDMTIEVSIPAPVLLCNSVDPCLTALPAPFLSPSRFVLSTSLSPKVSPKKSKSRRPATADLLQPKRTKSPFSIAPSTAPLSLEPSTSDSRSTSPSLNLTRGHSRNHTAPSSSWFSSAPATKTEFGQSASSISPVIPMKGSFSANRKLSIKRIKPPKWLESPKVQEPSTPEIQSWRKEGSNVIDNFKRNLEATDDDDMRLWSEEELNKEVFGIGKKEKQLTDEVELAAIITEETGKMREKSSLEASLDDTSGLARSSINSQRPHHSASALDQRISLDHRIATPSHLGGSPLSTSALLKEIEQSLPMEGPESKMASIAPVPSNTGIQFDPSREIVPSLQGLGLYNYSEQPPKRQHSEPDPLPPAPRSEKLFPAKQSSPTRPTTPNNPKPTSQPSSNEPSPTSLNLNRPRSVSSGTATGSNSGSGGGSARAGRSAVDLLALVRNGRRRGGTDASLMSAGSSASRAGRPYSLISLSADDTPIMRLRKLVVDTADQEQEEEEVRKLFFRAPGVSGRKEDAKEEDAIRSSSAPLTGASSSLLAIDPASLSSRRRSASGSSLPPRTIREAPVSRLISQPSDHINSKPLPTSGVAPISPAASVAHSSGSSTVNAHKQFPERRLALQDQFAVSSSAGLSSRRSFPVRGLRSEQRASPPQMDEHATETKDQARALTTDAPHRAGKHRRTGTNVSMSTSSTRASMLSTGSGDTAGEDAMSALDAEVGRATRAYVESARVGKGKAENWAASKDIPSEDPNSNVDKGPATSGFGRKISAQSFGQTISQGSSNASLSERDRIHASARPSSPPTTVVGSESSSAHPVKETSPRFSTSEEVPDQNESKAGADASSEAARLGQTPSKRIRHSQSQPINASSHAAESSSSSSRRRSPAKTKSASRLRTRISRPVNASDVPVSSVSAPLLESSRPLKPSRSGNLRDQSPVKASVSSQLQQSASSTSLFQDQTSSTLSSNRFNTSSTSGRSDKSTDLLQGSSSIGDLRQSNLERLFENEDPDNQQDNRATSGQTSGRTSAAASAAPTSLRTSPSKRLQTFATSEEAALAKRKEQLEREKRAKEKAKEASRKREEKYAAKKAADPLLARRLALVGLLAPTSTSSSSSSSKLAKSATSETIPQHQILGLTLGAKSSLSEMSRSSSRDSPKPKKMASLSEPLDWDFKPPPSIPDVHNPFKTPASAAAPHLFSVPLASKTPPSAFKHLDFLHPSTPESSSNEASPVRPRPNIYARSNASSFGLSQTSFHTAREPSESGNPIPVSTSESRRSSAIGSDTTERIGSFETDSTMKQTESGLAKRKESYEGPANSESSHLPRPSTSASVATLDLPSHFPQPPNRALKAQRSDDGTVLSRAGLESRGSESLSNSQKSSTFDTSPSARFYNRSASVRREGSDESASPQQAGNVTPRSSPAKLAQLVQTQDVRASMRASIQRPSPEAE